jgi:hypothetical protein
MPMGGSKQAKLKAIGLLTTLAVGLLTILFTGASSALDLSQMSVAISTAVPSATASHTFQFFVPSPTTVGSIVFEYCSNSPLFDDPCAAPAGANVKNAALASQTGNTGFIVDSANSTSNKLVISRAPLNASVILTNYIFSNITNPSTGGATTFVRISTYASVDGSGSYTDRGAVAFATEVAFTVGAFVPPFLQLCVGITVTPNCSSVSGDSINLGVLSPNHANAGQSQFAIATNSASGYIVYSLGNTMTSGNNIIPALAIPTTNFPGTGQFGINLRANLSPPVGQDPVGTGTGTPTLNYNTPNRFMFSNGDSLVISPLPSDYNRMTVSYLVNVPPNQIPGIYSTTVTYLAVVQF